MRTGTLIVALIAGCSPWAPLPLHAGAAAVSTEAIAVRTYAWTRTLDKGGFEHAVVERRGAAMRIRGEILAAHEGAPLRVTYTVATDAQGASRQLVLRQEFGGRVRHMLLVREASGWLVDGTPRPELDGCSDIDIGLSPATNALPLSRLAGGGDAFEVCAAWVRFPSLSVDAAVQRYTRVAPDVWRYQSLASGFSAELQVDDWFLPVVYDGVWERVARSEGGAGRERRGFAEALLADAPSPQLGEHARDFDWLVGGWDAVVRDIAEDGTVQVSRGEWWFSWVLEGRAMQDVWISPPRAERSVADAPAPGRYGTTIRRFDHTAGTWRISWINPANGAENELSGGREGDAIVLLGVAQGRPIRWQFVDIRADRFRWQGYRLEADGVTWRLQAEFDLRRMGAPDPGREGGVSD